MQGSLQQKIFWLTNWIIAFAIIITLVTAVYLTQPWRFDAATEWRLSSYYFWAICPYFFLLWANFREHERVIQTVLILIFTIIEFVIGLVFYSLALINHLHPNLHLVLVVVPLYQLLISMIAIISVLFFESE
jgi:hypothetical protein